MAADDEDDDIPPAKQTTVSKYDREFAHGDRIDLSRSGPSRETKELREDDKAEGGGDGHD